MTITAAHCTGRVDAEREPWLAAKLRLGDPGVWPGMRAVKQSSVRTILAGDGVHVKLFRAVRLSDRARDALSGSRADKELDNLCVARARGIACVRPIAAVTMQGSLGARSFLITETAPGNALPRGPLPEELAARVGAFLRDAHDRGLHALDLHSGNLLLNGNPGNTTLVLLDLTSASLGTPLEAHERARALAFFCQDLDGGVFDPAAAPLLLAYRASDWVRQRAWKHGEVQRRHALDSYGRRALRACKETQVEHPRRGPSWFLHLPAQELHEAARALIANEAELPPLKSGRRGSVHADGPLVCKTRPAAAAKRLFVAAYWLAFAKVPHPLPVLLRLQRGQGHVVTERLPWPTLAGERLAARDVLLCARSLGESLGRMHALGLRNRDLKLDNLVFDPTAGRVQCIDLDGIKRKDPKDTRGQAHDLGRLLAAFRAAGSPANLRALAAFRRSYSAALACLSRTRPTTHLWRLTASRADAWATAHRAR